MNQKNLIIITLVILALGTFKVLTQNDTPNAVVSVENTPVFSKKDQKIPSVKTYSQENVQSLKRNTNKNQVTEYLPQAVKDSKRIYQDYSKKAYLKMPDMDDFVFSDFSQDDVAVISGKNNKNEIFTVLASEQIINPSLLNTLIPQAPELFPINNKGILKGSFQKVHEVSNGKNGFSNVSVYTKEVNGRFFVLSYAPRADQKGSYGVLIEGKKEELDNNFEYYVDKLTNFKALNE